MSEYGGYSRMLSQHLGKCLTEEQRTRWVELLLQSAREAGLPNDAEFRSAFGAYIEWGSRLAVENSQTGAKTADKRTLGFQLIWQRGSFDLWIRRVRGHDRGGRLLIRYLLRYVGQHVQRHSCFIDVGSGRSWAYTEALVGTSPNQGDQELFLAIFKQMTPTKK